MAGRARRCRAALADDIIDFVLEQRTTFSPTDRSSPCTTTLVAARAAGQALDLRARDAHSPIILSAPLRERHCDRFCRREEISEADTLGVHLRGTEKPGKEKTHVKPSSLSRPYSSA